MTKRVAFTEDGARRIVAATKAYEAGSRDMPPVVFRDTGDDFPVRIGKTTSQWLKGTLATVTIHEGGFAPNFTAATPPETILSCVNLSHDVDAGEYVVISIGPGSLWYLVESSMPSVRICQTSAAWTKGTQATLSVYEAGTNPASPTSSGTTLDAYNVFANVASGKKVAVSRAGNGAWYLVAAEC